MFGFKLKTLQKWQLELEQTYSVQKVESLCLRYRKPCKLELVAELQLSLLSQHANVLI